MPPTRIDSAPAARPRPLSDPAREYVVGGTLGAFSPNGGLVLAQVYDAVVRRFGTAAYEMMEHESAVAAALWMLKAGALGDGLKLQPKVQAEPGKVVSKRKLRTDIKLAGEIFESCERVAAGLGDGYLYEATFELADALVHGCALAEQVFTLSESGDDRGKQVPTAFDVKPNWAWQFVCDPYMNVRHYRCWTEAGWLDVEPEHFTRFTWRAPRKDPRGRSILRPAYSPFNVLVQAFPDYGEYLKKFASASLILKAGEKTQDKIFTDAGGRTRTFTVQEQLVHAGKDFRNHSVLALPYGADAEVVTSQGTGQAFLSGFDYLERQIFRAVILGTRPMQEAKHGSKADTESGADLFSMAAGSVARPLAGALRNQFWRRYVDLNWGPEVAARLTPEVAFGSPDHINPDLIRAFSDAWSKGLFEEEHRPFLWSKVSVPTPEGWEPDHTAPRPGLPGPAAPPGPPGGGPPPDDGGTPPPAGPPAKKKARPKPGPVPAAR